MGSVSTLVNADEVVLWVSFMQHALNNNMVM